MKTEQVMTIHDKISKFDNFFPSETILPWGKKVTGDYILIKRTNITSFIEICYGGCQSEFLLDDLILNSPINHILMMIGSFNDLLCK